MPAPAAQLPTEPTAELSTADLWRRYMAARDAGCRPHACGGQMCRPQDPQDDRNALVVRYRPLVETVAAGMARRLPGNVTAEELASAGIVGLIGAIEHFDPARGANFTTYATRRVRGAMLDWMREMDWTPRQAHTRLRLRRRTALDLERRLGRAPEPDEVRAALTRCHGAAEADRIERTTERAVLSLSHKLCESESGRSHRMIDALVRDEGPPALDDAESFGRLIRPLPRDQRVMLTLYFREDLTMREIGQAIGLSESRVSQLISEALRVLKANLSN